MFTRSQTYGPLLQNVPSRAVMARGGLPDGLSLPNWINTRELRLDFFHGVRFPGGQVERRAVVQATLESLDLDSK